ncbi:LPXTG cell wall anchor domain-containing protein [Streptomyces bacillaris]|uniref:LPXTG cell wall anchor domain-containing protein n=1 Tax=Streptomyces bacillaris TaxID=68179 RepID=UPI003822EBEB
MKIRRILATAVVAAVTTPAVMLSVTPAFADTKPAEQTQAPAEAQAQAQKQAQAQNKPTLKELEKAAAEAQKAYDAALAAEKAAEAAVEAATADTAPLAVAAKAARKTADDAAAAKDTADKAVKEAQKTLDELAETATDEERKAAEKALADVTTAAGTAAAAHTTAETDAKTAQKLLDDARVEAFRVLHKAREAVKETHAAKAAADAAVERAKEEENQGGGEECVDDPGLTTTVTGFPDTVTAGTVTTFSVRVANDTGKDLDRVLTYAGVHASDKDGVKDIAKYLKLKWSTAASPKWQNVDGDLYIDAIGALKQGKQADIKLRLDVDAKAPAGQGLTFIAGDYFNEDGSCGLTPDAAVNEFDIKAAAAKPVTKPSPKPSTAAPAGGSGVTPQGSGSSVPVNTTNGTLAATGSSDATAQLALAAGAAVVLGAGAVFITRRRKAGADA